MNEIPLGSYTLLISVKDFLLCSDNAFIEQMKKHWDNVSDYALENSQIKAWADSYDVLHRALSQLPDAYRKLWIVFEYVLPNHNPSSTKFLSENHIRADAILISEDTVLVLEFKQRNDDFVGLFHQAKKYQNRLERYHVSSENMVTKSLLVLTKSFNYQDNIVSVPGCSPDRLSEMIIMVFGSEPERYSDIEEWVNSDFVGYTSPPKEENKDSACKVNHLLETLEKLQEMDKKLNELDSRLSALSNRISTDEDVDVEDNYPEIIKELSKKYLDSSEIKTEFYYSLEDVEIYGKALVDYENGYDYREYYSLTIKSASMCGEPVEVYGEEAVCIGISSVNRYICFDETFELGLDTQLRRYDAEDYFYSFSNKPFNPVAHPLKHEIDIGEFVLTFNTPLEFNLAFILFKWSDEMVLTEKIPSKQIKLNPFFLTATDTWKHNISVDDTLSMFSIESVSYNELDDYNYKPYSCSGSGKLTFFISLCPEWKKCEERSPKGIEYYRIIPLNTLLERNIPDDYYPKVSFLSEHGGTIENGASNIRDHGLRGSFSDVFCSGGEQFFFLQCFDELIILGDPTTHCLMVTRYRDGWGGVFFQLENEHDYYLLGAWLTVALSYLLEYYGKGNAGHFIREYWPWYSEHRYNWHKIEKSNLKIDLYAPALPFLIKFLTNSISVHLERTEEIEDIWRREETKRMRKIPGNEFFHFEYDPPLSNLIPFYSIKLLCKLKDKTKQFSSNEAAFITDIFNDLYDTDSLSSMFTDSNRKYNTPEETTNALISGVVDYDNDYLPEMDGRASLARELLYYYVFLIWGFMLQENVRDGQIGFFNRIIEYIIEEINESDLLFGDREITF